MYMWQRENLETEVDYNDFLIDKSKGSWQVFALSIAEILHSLIVFLPSYILHFLNLSLFVCQPSYAWQEFYLRVMYPVSLNLSPADVHCG
jgi:hypothetical protein